MAGAAVIARLSGDRISLAAEMVRRPSNDRAAGQAGAAIPGVEMVQLGATGGASGYDDGIRADGVERGPQNADRVLIVRLQRRGSSRQRVK